MSLSGQRLGTLRIDRPLGEGGMGEVYLGFDEKLERRVAVKRLLAEHRLRPESKARLLREARLLSKVGHPAICQIFDLIEAHDADCLVLEYVDGETLRQKMRSRMPYDAALDLCRQIADGLAAAHREQVIHRDLKPENVMVNGAGRAKILDFGVARAAEGRDAEGLTPVPPAPSQWPADPDDTADGSATYPLPGSADLKTRHGTILGTLHCMSPEQARGETLTTASDLYSLGLLMQELFTGRPVYPNLPAASLWNLVQRGETARVVGLEPELTALIDELKQHDPMRRPTAIAVGERLDSIASLPARRRRRRLLTAAGVGAAIFLLVALIATTWLAVAARQARREAERRQGQAEDLIGFMLGDLRPKLERAGRLDLLDSVGERALRYFDSVPESELSNAELVRRVEALRQLSEVRSTGGDVAAAIEVAERAVFLGRAVVARAPKDASGFLALSRACAALGAARIEAAEKPDAALADFEAGLAAARTAAKLAPADADVRRQVGGSLSNLGAGQFQARQFDASAASLTEALAVLEPSSGTLDLTSDAGIAAAEELAATLAWTSTTMDTLGRLAEATTTRRRNLEIQEQLLRRAPDDPVAAHDLATARDFHARLLLAQGRDEEAESEQRTALAEFDRLRALDADNADWERSAAVGRGNLGWILFDADRSREALVELRAARRALATLRLRDPAHRIWARLSGVTAYRIAAVAEDLGEVAAARVEIAAALADLEALHREDPDDALAAQRYAEALLLAGKLDERRADASSAKDRRERAHTLLARLGPETGGPALAALWVRALLDGGRLDEARPIVERLARSGYGARRYVRAVRNAGL